MFGFFKGWRESVIDTKLVYLLSNGKDGGILKDVYYEACSKYCQEHGGESGDPISQCWVSYEGSNKKSVTSYVNLAKYIKYDKKLTLCIFFI